MQTNAYDESLITQNKFENQQPLYYYPPIIDLQQSPYENKEQVTKNQYRIIPNKRCKTFIYGFCFGLFSILTFELLTVF